MNSVVLIGRLGNDPELSSTTAGTALAKFRLAVDRPPRQEGGEQETDWLNVVCWGRQAQAVNDHLHKGALVAVEGRVQSRSWERHDGSRGYGVEINARRVQFLPRGGRRGEEEARSGVQDQPRDEQEDPFGDQ